MKDWPYATGLALAGAVGIMLAALVTVRTPGNPVPPAAGVALPLAEAAVLEWSYTTEGLGLKGLRLVQVEPAPAGASVELRIAEATTPELPLVETTVPLGDAGPAGELELGFDPIAVSASPHSTTATLQVRLVAVGLEAGERLVLAGASGEAGEPLPAFTPIYQVRPFDSLWPVSAMASGRIGLLGWSPFYALLAYSFLIIAVGWLRRLWQVRAGEHEHWRR